MFAVVVAPDIAEVFIQSSPKVGEDWQEEVSAKHCLCYRLLQCGQMSVTSYEPSKLCIIQSAVSCVLAQ
jgi:hypothetical protein